ncbi:MAG: hypothetical protein RR060_05710 [Victivallaceae bacterium]
MSDKIIKSRLAADMEFLRRELITRLYGQQYVVSQGHHLIKDSILKCLAEPIAPGRQLDLDILQRMLDLLLKPYSYVMDYPSLVTTYCRCDLPPDTWQNAEVSAEQRWSPEALAEVLGEVPALEQYSLRLDAAAQYIYEILRRLQPVSFCYVPVHSTDIFEGD